MLNDVPAAIIMTTNGLIACLLINTVWCISGLIFIMEKNVCNQRILFFLFSLYLFIGIVAAIYFIYQ